MLRCLLQSMVIAFAMYSAIPCPRVEWNEKNMRWAMCFFPLVGAVIGLVLNGWYALSEYLHLAEALRAAVLTVLPLLITGGIHMDGFLDTVDALSSHKPMEEKHRILKDPGVGAFAVIAGGVFFLLSFGAFSQADAQDLPLIGLTYVLSRAYSAFALVLFPKAKTSGLLRSFSDSAGRKAVVAVMVVFIAAASCGMIILHPAKGSLACVLALLVFWWYHHMSIRQFGGITGDLAGYFLQIFELILMFGIVLR